MISRLRSGGGFRFRTISSFLSCIAFKAIDEREVRLNRVVAGVGDEIEYQYDFGDDWRHHLTLEAILLPAAKASYPRCIEGARSGPPDDVGGPPGYSEYLKALADPEHERHEELTAWRGPFDPEAFSLRKINASLTRTFHRQRKSSPPTTKK